MNDMLSKLLAIAKVAVYNKKRSEQYLPMLDTQLGAVTAVMGVIAAIQAKVQVPPDVTAELAKKIYLMMVDVAMTATGEKPDGNIMKATMKALLQKLSVGAAQAPQQPGMIQGAP